MNFLAAGSMLSGRHALVTGGSRGIGRAVATALLSQGAQLTLLGRHSGSLREAATEMGANVATEEADVADADSVDSALERAQRRHGSIAILVNSAGQAGSALLHKTDAALWRRLIEVNLTGTFHCIRAVLPFMLAADFGRIVNVASTAGQVGYPYVAAYCAAKHGVIGLTRALALETARRHITVNAVCPGYTDTDIARQAIANICAKTGRSEAEALASMVANNPQRRLIMPAEVANAVLWLCLPGSESVTGQSISVAGGEVS